MDIYKYDHTTKEWDEIRNSNLKRKEIEAAFDNYIKTKGQKVSLQDYFKDGDRNNFSLHCEKSYSYKCFGEAENCFERLAKEEIDWDEGLCYCSTRDRSPEDLIESRTDWNEMKSYADGLYYFIESLKGEIARGEIKLVEKKPNVEYKYMSDKKDIKKDKERVVAVWQEYKKLDTRDAYTNYRIAEQEFKDKYKFRFDPDIKLDESEIDLVWKP